MAKRTILIFGALTLFLFAGRMGRGQTANTGALVGTITDASGAVVTGVQVAVTNEATGQSTTTTTGRRGSYLVPLLPPGSYQVEATKSGFKVSDYSHVTIKVTETATLKMTLQVGAVSEKVVVTSNGQQLDTADAQLGTVIDQRFISNLPLAARNYLQIIGLNAGVSAELTDAGDLGRGSSSLATGSAGFSANGAATNDNDFQMNGVPVNDNFSAGEFTGGIPIPNPDTLEEFKVATTPYDASNGRDGGANVDVITKTGSNDLHVTLFEFFRNNDLNANLWFLNTNHQPRAILKQNQFGGTVGGRIIRDKVFYFGSYQGTRQRNGLSSGCATTTLLPPLTDDRSAAGIGSVFVGQRGLYQDALGGVGPAIAADGSNINPVALNLLQLKLPNGQYVIPTPQTPNSSAGSFDTEGSSSFSVACPFSEDQYMANGDYVQSDKSSIQVRYFMANSSSVQTIPGARPAGNGVPGFPFSDVTNFKNGSLNYTYVFSPALVNQAQVGFNRSYSTESQGEQFSWSSVGATVPAFVDHIPGIGISAMGLGGDAENTIEVQNTLTVHDSLAWEKGRHSIRFGGEYEYSQTNSPYLEDLGGAYFLTFADFVLGLNGDQNGTAAAGLPESNEYLDEAVAGNLGRHYRFTDYSAYAQDDIKITQRLTFNAGVRFEHLGDFSEAHGINTGVDTSLLNPNPPAGGTLQGYVVPGNYPGTPPPGVTRLSNNYGIKGLGQNYVEPRIGFAWQLPGTDRLVLRGGYGIYRSQLGANGLTQNIASPPFASLIVAEDTQNAPATLQNPIWQPIPTFPSWPAAEYSPTTAQAFDGFDQRIEAPVVQHYSLDLQTELARDFVLDIAYGGARSTKLWDTNWLNQAPLASPQDPIRGETTNTLANVALRVPYEGWSSYQFALIKSIGQAWYNSMQVTLNKRFSHGLQFIAAYTWVQDLTDLPGATTGGGFGSVIFGDQNNLHSNYGPEPFIRPQRFVLSYIYAIPYPGNLSSFGGRVLGGWQLAGVTTAQAGHRLFATNSNGTNAYGVPYDRPDYTPGCTVHKSGSVQSRINSYFNTSCFPPAPVIGADGVATAFGDAPIGNIVGPSEFDNDVSLSKIIPVKWPKEAAQLDFKTDFFNIFNHPIFGDPSTEFAPGGAPGTVTGTVSNPRVIQFSLKYLF